MAKRYLAEDGIAGAVEKSSVPETLYVDLQGDQRTRPILSATEFSSTGIHKKKSTSFQITSVTVQGSRLSNDGGEDSADDLDESHTEDISSDILDCSKTTDLDNDPLSSDNSNANLDDLGVSVASKQFIPVKVLTNDPDPFGASHSIGVSPGLSGDNTVVDSDLTLVTSTNTPLPVINTQVPIVNSLPEHLQHRFKVVKIVSTEPFKRGRWLCMDFTDPPTIHGEPRVETSETTDTTHVSSSFNVVPSDNPPSVAQFYEFPVNQTNISNIPQPQQTPQSVYGLLLPVANNLGVPVTKVQNVGVQVTPTIPIESVKHQAVAIQVQPITTQSQATQASVPTPSVSLPQSQLVQVAPSSAQNQTVLPTTQTQGVYPTASQVSQPNQGISTSQSTQGMQTAQHQQAMSASQQPQVLPATQGMQTSQHQQTMSANQQPQVTTQGMQTTQHQQAMPTSQQQQVLTATPGMQTTQHQQAMSAAQQPHVLPATQGMQTTQHQQTIPATQQPQVLSGTQGMQTNQHQQVISASQQTQGLPAAPGIQTTQHQQALSTSQQPTTASRNQQGLPVIQPSSVMPQPVQVISGTQQSSTLPVSQQPLVQATMQPNPILTTSLAMPQSHVMASSQPAQGITVGQPSQGLPISQPNPGLPATQSLNMPVAQPVLSNVPQLHPISQPSQILPMSQPVGLPIQSQPTMLNSTQPPQDMSASQPNMGVANSQPNQGLPSLQPNASLPVQSGHVMTVTQTPQGLPVTNQPLAGGLPIGMSVAQSNTSLPATQSGAQPVLVADTLPVSGTLAPAGIITQPVDTLASSQSASKSSPPVQGSVKDIQMSTSNQSPLLDILPDTLGTKMIQDGEETESASSGTNTVAIDNKIEQAMDLVKSHLMFAVREEVDVLKEKITELMDRISQLEHENGILKANATPEMLNQLNSDQGGGGGGAPPSNSQQTPAANHEHS